MAVTQNPAVRDVLKQIVSDPDYNDVARVPVISIHQIAMILLAYGGTAFGIVGYLKWGFPLWVSYPIMIYCMFVGFTPLHDATHKAVSSNPLINDILGTISAQTLFPGFNVPTYRALHLEHHRYTGDKELDPDERLVNWPKNWGPLYVAFVDIHWAHWYFTSAWNRWPKNMRPWVIGTLLAIIAIYAIGLTSPYWYEFIILYIIPHRLAVLYVVYMFAHIQHPEGLTWEKEPFQSTVRIVGNPLKRLSLLGQADHAMHHLLPHVPWYKYHRVWDLANGILYRQNIPDRGIFTGPKEIILPDLDIDYPVRQKAKISKVESVAKDIKSFTLRPADSKGLKSFDAGSHIDIYLPSGLVRQYSLLNAPSEQNLYQIAAKLDPNSRGGSEEIHKTFELGDTLSISEPRQNFTLYENARRYILIAGGVGITPLLSMAFRLTELGKPFELHICAKSEDEIPFAGWIDHWPFAAHVKIHLDNEQGRSSLNALQVLENPGEKDLVYICGPKGFMNWLERVAKGQDWKAEQIHIENFTAPIGENLGNKAFDVKLTRSGTSLRVSEDMSILDALRHANIKVPYACQQGTCGTCIAGVVEGEVDHRDAYLNESEKQKNDQICVCVSRAKTKSITLDL